MYSWLYSSVQGNFYWLKSLAVVGCLIREFWLCFRDMRFRVEHSFTFPHGKLFRVIFSDLYEDNYISPCLALRLPVHPKVRSSCFYRDDRFIVPFKLGDFISRVECCLENRLLEGHLVVLGRTWLNGRKCSFTKVSNTLQICEHGTWYPFQVRPFGMGSLLSNFSHLERMKRLQAISDKIQLLIQQRNAKVDDSKTEIVAHA